ncbi:LacI family DNA-binding transcriptional regulator [Oceaniglobus ichthyenteri]|uniref:LacI family DNA-binding transcriptional regulator n=1 Tax=Oceaniglobus ichthyenteri TaxID=2136177 RepID=UPI000D37BF87|nr:LacI family DNA-binding transcriptional regulator [Oceaniglobus ichthyenteri]
MSDKIRISDVAALAGVSTATVSRALAAPGRVGKETREKVLKAVHATGYQVNAAARDLRQRRARSILILAPNLSNTFFSRIFAAIQEEASDAGLTVQISDSRIGREKLATLGHDGRADGIILLDGEIDPELVNSWRLPVIQLCEWNPAYHAPSLAIDNAAAAGLAVRHLADLGHRNLLHIAGPAGNILAQTRLAGFQDAAQAAGVAAAVLPGDFTMESGAGAAHQWAASTNRPTGVFCASDECALGFISDVMRLGFDVPGQVSVVGFDDIEFADRFNPALTTVHQPRATLGRDGARQLIKMLAGGVTDPVLSQVVPAHLVTRVSTGKAPTV